MACNLMLKSEGNKKLTVEDLEDQKEIFKDLKFIDLHNREDIKSKKELFNAIELGPEDFGTDRKGSDFSVVYCSYLNHDFVMIIDKTKEWNKAIDKDIESIYLIDSSSLNIKGQQKPRLYHSLRDKKDIFDSTPTLNQSYQANCTCWLNAMSAVGFLLERQQERIAKQRKKQQEQVEQTERHEQQPRKPYGLSIGELLEGFDKKRNNESGKIVNSLLEHKTYPFAENAHYPPQYYQPFYNYNSQYGLRNYPVRYSFAENTYYPPQYYQPFYRYNSPQYGLRNYPVRYSFVENAHNTCNYSLEENLSLFEQGICDYSTKHFYPLINLSKKEKYIITKFLAEQVKKNKINQERLKTMSERLEASRINQLKALTVEQQKINKEKISGDLIKKLSAERIIIKYTYLKESLERIAQDADKLEKFCIGFGIFEQNQEENSSNKKRSSSWCLGDITNAEGNISLSPKQYKKQNQQNNNL